jgi:signal transduction histidine kinase
MLVTIRDNSFREQYRTQLDLFTRVLRHNLRNDMNVLRGYFEVICDRIEDTTVEDLGRKGMAKCDRMLEISEQTRRLRETLSAEYREFDTTIDLVPIVADIVEEFDAEYPDATMETDLPDSTPARARENIAWAVENLVENAIVHADDDPQVYVGIEGERVERDGLESEWTTLTVADRGPGIPESEAAVLDDDAARSDTEHGSGLGLWTAKQLVEIFDGQFEIDRNPASAFSTEVRLRLQPGSDAVAAGE